MSPRMPQVTARELVAFLRKHGFVDHRQSGSHLSLRHPLTGKTVTVAIHMGADVGRGLAVRILKSAGFSVEDFIRLR